MIASEYLKHANCLAVLANQQYLEQQAADAAIIDSEVYDG